MRIAERCDAVPAWASKPGMRVAEYAVMRRFTSLAAIVALAVSACSGRVENRHEDNPDAGPSSGGGAGGSPNDSGGAGGASTGGVPQTGKTVSEPSQIAGRSFNVTLDSCETIATGSFGCNGWVAHVRATGNGGLELVSSAGALDAAPLVRDGSAWKIAAAFRLGEGVLGLSGIGVVPRLEARQLSFVFNDGDGDGRADGFTATGTGYRDERSDDYSTGHDVVLKLTGKADHDAPRLSTDVGVRNPLDPVYWVATEPLAETATSKLVGPGNVDGASEQKHGSVASMGFSTERILDPGTTWQWTASGTDLGGNAFDASTTVQVAAAPDYVTGDFEGAAPFALLGRTEPCAYADPANSGALSSVKDVPALEGAKSFYVAAADKVLFKLRRPGGTKFVRLDLQSIGSQGSIRGGLTVRAGVIGGTARPGTRVEESGTHGYLDDAGAANDVAHLELPLADAGDTVLVEVSGTCAIGIWSWSTGAWIDSLRVE